MILADKIIRLRKKNGWSQEELADKLQVSRQAVSKWEGAQTIPDIERILAMSRLFGVTVDYLLKDEQETETFTKEEEAIRQVSLEEAGQYLALRRQAAKQIALGTYLCILGIIPMLLLGGAAETGRLPITENMAGGVGLTILLMLVAVAVGLFIYCGGQSHAYAVLEKEPFQAAYGVIGMVKARRKEYHSTYVRGNILGACLCILGAAPLFLSAAREDEWVSIVMLCCMFALSGLGVATLILVGVPWAAMEKLLQEGSYSPKEKSRSKARSRLKEQLSGLYWLLATAIFLAVGLEDHNWAFARVYWPVVGVLFAGLMVVLDLVLDKREAPDPEEDGEP